MNEIEIKDICLRIAEYNLRANAYFSLGISELSITERKALEIEREQLTTYVHSKYPMVKIHKYLRQLKKFDEEGNLIRDMPNDMNTLINLLKEGISKNGKTSMRQM